MNPDQYRAWMQDSLNLHLLKTYEFTVRCDDCDNPAVAGICVKGFRPQVLCAAHRSIEIRETEKEWGPLKNQFAKFLTEVKL